jgi:hypothetical protein
LAWIEAVKEGKRDAALKVVTAMGVPHGFNVFPDAWLKEEHVRLKKESYQLAVDFIREKWGKEVVEAGVEDGGEAEGSVQSNSNEMDSLGLAHAK